MFEGDPELFDVLRAVRTKLARERGFRARIGVEDGGTALPKARLDALATKSGGLALFPADPAALDTEYQKIVENLRRRYVLSYTSSNTTRDGKFRNVSIESAVPGTVVHQRGGYWAPDDGRASKGGTDGKPVATSGTTAGAGKGR